ncbi:hypothetical protein [Prosthecobacter sp.]|jgi:hypothetical protein|uniref:hypothetical protein n=1 Tax=Prosthecobacter sp. TaxID=1965333 RepID=UPI0037C61E65
MATAKSQTKHLQGNFTLWAKTRLLRKKLSVTKLASQLELARNTVSIAINHPTMMPAVQKRIREALA